MAITEEQRQFRSTGIGGSDAGIILGISPFKDPLSLYLEKRGEVPPEDENNFKSWGHILEPGICDAYTERTGFKLRRDNRSLRSKTHPFMLMHVDRRVLKCGNRRIMDAKNTSRPYEWGRDGTSDVPGHINAQAQHYIHVDNLDQVDIACLMNGNELRVYPLERDDDFIRDLIEVEEEFWDRVEAGVPPEPDFSSTSVTKLIKRLYPGTNGDIVRLPGIAQSYHDVAVDAAKRRLEIEKVEKGCKNRIAMMIREGAVGILPDGTIYNRKEVQRAGHFVEPSSYFEVKHTKRVPKSVNEAIEAGKAVAYEEE